MARTKHTSQAQTESNRKSESDDNNQTTSESDASVDFLGRPPSNPTSESVDPTQESEEEEEEEEEGESSRRQRSPTRKSNSRRSRKQSNPVKKRRDNVTKEIVKLQKTTNTLIPRLPFQRLVREILQKYKNDFRVQSTTLECLQEAAETYITQIFEDSFLCCLHRQRVTLTDKDMRLILILRGPSDAGRN